MSPWSPRPSCRTCGAVTTWGQEGGQVVLYHGTSQDLPLISLHKKAPANDQPNPPIPVADLPESDRVAIEEGKRAFIGLKVANAELAKLEDRRAECRKHNPTISDCRARGGRS